MRWNLFTKERTAELSHIQCMFPEQSVNGGGSSSALLKLISVFVGTGSRPYPCPDARKIVYFTKNTPLIMQYETSQLLSEQLPMGSAAVIIFSFVRLGLCVSFSGLGGGREE